MEQPSRILVVDDEPLVRQMVRDVLADYEVVLVDSADEAAELLGDASQSFDLLITDRKMPGKLDGDDLLRLVRTEHPGTQVLVMTAYKDLESVRACFALGGFDYLLKPVNIDDLRGVVKRALSGKEPDAGMEIAVPNDDWIELIAPSHTGFLRRFQRFCDLLFETRFDEKTQRDLRLAVEELGKNAVEWGNEGDLERRIKITFCVFPDAVMFRIEDEGEGFKPEAGDLGPRELMRLQSERKATGKRPGGMGLALVEKIMDEVTWSEKGNCVICTKRLAC